MCERLMKCGISFALCLCLCLFPQCSFSLEQQWVNSIAGMNCTPYVMQQHDGTLEDSVKNKTLGCPPWYLLNENKCKPGKFYKYVVHFEPGTGQPLLLPFYCMTTSDNTDHRDVLGGCLLTTSISHLITYFPLPCNIMELNKFMCAGLNRDGQLCGKCKKGFAPPAYSYSLHCVNCTEYGYQNWLKYTAIAFGPLTLFCAIIIAFHINATSTYLHGYILFCQLLTLPTILRLLVNNYEYNHQENIKWSINVYASIAGIWNLDFFRLIYQPFCLHPHMTFIQSLALDYLIALYPLLVVAITYYLVTLYSRNCRVVVYLWRPLRKILRPILRDFDIKSTLIESFATLYLLSLVKILSVSLDLFLPTKLYYANGEHSTQYRVYLAGDIPYFSNPHFPYALLAMVLSVVLVIIPTLVLFAYPCRCFQQVLNKANLNSSSLRIYMDVIQGHYKDGTESSRDFRYFAGIFIVAKMVVVLQAPLMNSYYSFVTIGLSVTVLAFSVAIIHPQKCYTRYLLDSLFLSCLSIMMFFLIGHAISTHNSVPYNFQRLLGIISSVIPLVYFILAVLYWIFGRKRILQRVLLAMKRVWLESRKQYTTLVNGIE